MNTQWGHELPLLHILSKKHLRSVFPEGLHLSFSLLFRMVGELWLLVHREAWICPPLESIRRRVRSIDVLPVKWMFSNNVISGATFLQCNLLQVYNYWLHYIMLPMLAMSCWNTTIQSRNVAWNIASRVWLGAVRSIARCLHKKGFLP